MEEKVNRQTILRLIKALNDEEELSVISKIISTDPALTAKLLKFVNSAYFSLKREIDSIEDAVAYLGYRKLREVAFSILLSSILVNKPKEEILKLLTFAYIMKLTAQRSVPELAEEAFMVGILWPIYKENKEETLKMLKEANVSKVVIDGLKDPKSPLGVLRVFAEKLLPYCEKLNNKEAVEIPAKTEKFKKEFLINICLSASLDAEKIIDLL